jgi:hypothetical protein
MQTNVEKGTRIFWEESYVKKGFLARGGVRGGDVPAPSRSSALTVASCRSPPRSGSRGFWSAVSQQPQDIGVVIPRRSHQRREVLRGRVIHGAVRRALQYDSRDVRVPGKGRRHERRKVGDAALEAWPAEVELSAARG